jgi:hypothetical protein
MQSRRATERGGEPRAAMNGELRERVVADKRERESLRLTTSRRESE